MVFYQPNWLNRQALKFWPGVDNQERLRGEISAMISHQFMVSSAIIHGAIDVETEKRYNNPQISKLMKKIFVETDEDIENAAPQKSGIRLTIELINA